MSKRFLISVAAIALMAGAGAANAQGTGMGKESGGAAMQHGAPSGTAATPANRDSAQPDTKATQSEQTAPGAAKGQRAEETAPGQKSKGMSSQTETKGGKDMKAETREGQSGNMKAEGRDNSHMKAEGREGRDNTKMNAESREGRDGKMNAESREGRDGKMNAESREGRDSGKMNAETKTGGDRSQTTTGQAGAGAKLSTEQRTQITTVIRNEHVAPVNNVNFSISVGTRIPREVRYHPLPAEVVTIYPEWRGYNYVLVRDQIVVIDPQTLEIVAILDV
jgi:Protein of unknown function (DUF1236)